jgi:hypothetical protein
MVNRIRVIAAVTCLGFYSHLFSRTTDLLLDFSHIQATYSKQGWCEVRGWIGKFWLEASRARWCCGCRVPGRVLCWLFGVFKRTMQTCGWRNPLALSEDSRHGVDIVEEIPVVDEIIDDGLL